MGLLKKLNRWYFEWVPCKESELLLDKGNAFKMAGLHKKTWWAKKNEK